MLKDEVAASTAKGRRFWGSSAQKGRENRKQIVRVKVLHINFCNFVKSLINFFSSPCFYI